jgi:hypothetical protein
VIGNRQSQRALRDEIGGCAARNRTGRDHSVPARLPRLIAAASSWRIVAGLL